MAHTAIINDKIDHLANLRSPVEVSFIKRLIRRSLEDDERYKDFLRDMRRHDEWDINTLRVHLEAAARLEHDLVDTDASKSAGSISKRAARKARQAANRAARADDVSQPTASGGQRAHPPPPTKGTPEAEREARNNEMRKRLAGELCRNHLLGTCRFGDSCYRSHMSLQQVEQERARQSTASATGTPNTKPAPTAPKPIKPPMEPSMGVCNQWAANGECEYGDNCKFTHGPTTAAGKMHRSQSGCSQPATELAPSCGDLVQLQYNHIVPQLRGALAQVLGPGIEGRWRMQIIVPTALRVITTTCGQIVYMAQEVGMLRSNFTIVPTAIRTRTLTAARSYRAHAAKAVSAYSANIIFDTGATDVFSGPHARGIFSSLTPLVTPIRVDGANGAVTVYTHEGPVTLVMGSDHRTFRGLYSESEDTTTVPGQMYDDNDYWYAARNRTLHIMRGDSTQPLASFPRDLKINPRENHSQTFLGSLGAKQDGGTRLHILYPMPDSIFVWHDAKSVNKVSKTESKKAPTQDEPAVAHPTTKAGIAPPRPTTAVTAVKTGTASSPLDLLPRDGALYVWAQGVNDGSMRAQAIMKALRELHRHHHRHGHRSHDHDVRQMEWMTGRRVPAEVVENARRCPSCEVVKITDKSYQSVRLLEPSRAGEVISADTIVSLPKSHSGYLHGAHMTCTLSNCGAFWPAKTKSVSHLGLFWLKHLHNLLGRPVAVFKIDSGEWLSTELKKYCADNGITIQPSQADTHANQSIERRNRTLEEVSGALCHRGGAGAHMWEYSMPTANLILNLTITIKKLREAGRPGKGRERPLTPFEELHNHGKRCNIQAMWKNLHDLFGRGVGYKEVRVGHEDRGEDIIYLGYSPRQGSVDFHAHLGLRLSDRTIQKYRTVRTEAIFPWKPAPSKGIEPYYAEFVPTLKVSGGELDVSAKGSTPLEIETMIPEPSTPAKVSLPSREPTESPLREDSGKIDKKLEKLVPGAEVMTTNGPCVILKRYDDTNQYCVRFDNDCEPQAAWTINSSQMWLSEDWPGWDFDQEGKRVGTLEVEAKQALTLIEPLEAKQHMPKGPGGFTRSRTKGKTARAVDPEDSTLQARIFDPGGDIRILTYPQKCYQARKARSTGSTSVPAGTPLTLSDSDLKEMLAADVERILPRHQHQTFGHPLRYSCAKGEVKELQSCLNRGVWGTPVEIRPEMVVIGLMWVYAIKAHLETGMFKSTRARITLMGNQERLNALIGRLDAYAPVAQMITSRLLIAMHLHIPGIIIRQLDVSNAYINENMRRIVHCRLPPGYTLEWVDEAAGTFTFRRLRPGERQPKIALPLLKALYGGMECGRIFWEAWVDWHLLDGFQIIHEERCYLCKRSPEGAWIKLGFHVDDNMILALGHTFYQAYLERLKVKFDVTEGPLQEHLGVLYTLDLENGVCHIAMPAQVHKVLKLFGHENCKAESTPMFNGAAPCAVDCEDKCEEDFDMQGFVGHITWLNMCVRPDLGQVLKILSRFTVNFGKRHVLLAKHVLRYLKGTVTLGLTYRSGFPLFYQLFTDASHASCVDTRRSIVSLVVKLGGNTVFWKVSFTTIVCHSSTESELMALDVGATVGQALRWLIQAMGGAIQGKIQVFVDNHGTIAIASNPIQAGRNLHVHARYFYVRDLVYDEYLVVCPLPTDLQVGDVGCTFKGGPAFLRLRHYLMECARIVHDENDNPQWEMLVSIEQ